MCTFQGLVKLARARYYLRTASSRAEHVPHVLIRSADRRRAHVVADKISLVRSGRCSSLFVRACVCVMNVHMCAFASAASARRAPPKRARCTQRSRNNIKAAESSIGIGIDSGCSLMCTPFDAMQSKAMPYHSKPRIAVGAVAAAAAMTAYCWLAGRRHRATTTTTEAVAAAYSC